MSVVPYDKIKVVHLEISSKCNALCPQCVRSVFGSVPNPNFEQKELSLESIQKIFSPDFIKQLDYIIINGNFGDPATHSDLFSILDFFLQHNPKMGMRLHSNGGIQSPGWWSKLAKFFNKSNRWVTFGIDGLEDTNHLYRVNVKWNKVIDNLKSFIDAGGHAVWDFIVFKHNQHQVEEVKAFAKSLGISWFNIKKTGRFAVNTVGSYEVRGTPVYDKNQNFSHLLEAATIKEYQNSEFSKADIFEEADDEIKSNLKHERLLINLEKNDQHYRNLENFFSVETIKAINDCDVDCYVKKEKSIFIDYNGHVFPCCWIAWPYFAFWHDSETIQTRQLLDNLGTYDLIDATKYPLQEILNGPYFKYVENGIHQRGQLERCVSCSKTCGTTFNHMSDERGES